MRTRRHRLAESAALLSCCLFAWQSASSGKEQPTGKEIMERVDTRDEGEDQVSKSVQRLINARGQERRRDSLYVKKNYKGKGGLDTKTIIFMQSPPQIKGTAFLNWSYEKDDKADDQWLYLPALRKVRRLSASDKEDSFMGTDFTYDDMGDRKVEEDDHKLLRSEALDGKDCYVVESVPKEKGYIYSKKVSWVVKSEWLLVKVDYTDRKGRRLKTLTFSGWKKAGDEKRSSRGKLTFEEWRKVEGIWVVGRMEMANHQTKHRTVLEIGDVKVNARVPDSTFTERTLKRGVRGAMFR